MQVQCKHCNGTGKHNGNNLSKLDCTYCLGRGHVSDSTQTDKGFIKSCEDSLKRLDEPKCMRCKDTKYIRIEGNIFGTCPDCVNGLRPRSLQHQEDGNHYLIMPIQPWEIIDAHNLNFYEGNIIKYLLREKVGQDRVMELKKAKHYLEHLIELEEKYGN